MKFKSKFLSCLMVLLCFFMAACTLDNTPTTSVSTSAPTTSAPTSQPTTSAPTSSSTGEVEEIVSGTVPSGANVLTEKEAIEYMKSSEYVEYTEIYVTGTIIDVYFNSQFGSYTLTLEEGFQIYSGKLESGVMEPEVGDTVVASGKTKIFEKNGSVTYEIAYDSSHKESPRIHQLTRKGEGNSNTPGGETTGTVPSGANVLTEAEAIEYMKSSEYVEYTEIFVKGIVKKVSFNSKFGSYTIDFENGFQVYSGQLEDGVAVPEVGDTVVASGKTKIFEKNGSVTYEIAYDSSHGESPKIHQVTKGKKEEVKLPEANSEITIAQAIEIAGIVGEEVTKDQYLITAEIKNVTKPAYGEMYLTDGKDEILVYNTKSKDGVDYAEMADQPVKGDIVTVLVTINMFNGVPQIKQAYIQSFEKGKFDISSYKEATILEARNATVDSKLIIDGVVAAITYKNGMIPDGIYLVDETSSIYVYGVDVASQAKKVGNKIKVAGLKQMFIAENEQKHANTFGYIGACQLSDVTVLEVVEGNFEFDKTWIQEKTVKELMDTPYSENITSLIYKVNALVKKDPQDGYTNYYIYDIDGTTGSYVYTKCNGADFTWLDEFDGKICTVYLSAINAKSQDIGCIWRLMPVQVKYENYQFNTADAAEFALEYHAVEQFKQKYTSNPELVLKTSVSSTLLGLDNITLEYSSSNTDVVSFASTIVEGKTVLVMNTGVVGTAEVTITANYQNITAVRKVTIEVAEPAAFSAISVEEAVKAAEDSEVTVIGVVTCGQPNKPAVFFLSDETGIIAVEFANASDMANINVGDEVVIKGTRTHSLNKGNATEQVVIYGAELVENLYGNNTHSTDSFIEVTAAELLNIARNMTVAQTNQGYIVKGVLSVYGTQYYTNYYFGIDDTEENKIQIYAGSGDQLSWLLDDYLGKEVTVELVMCDWSNKSDSYRFSIIAIHTEDGKIINTYSFAE